jgi:hypothetical protein
MVKKLFQEEKGQSIVLVVLCLVGLVGFLALAIDGGAAFAARRQMQNAADSAAIAGAKKLQGNETDVDLILREINAYAEENKVPDTNSIPGDEINGNVTAYFIRNVYPTFDRLPLGDPKTLDDPYWDTHTVPSNAAGVEVITRTTFDPYFAGVVGVEELGAAAQAKVLAEGEQMAGALSNLFPVALYNADPGNCELDPWLDDDCEPIHERLIIWDTEMEGPGNFGWVDFNGGSNSNAEIRDWIENGYQGMIEIPSWVQADTGNRGASEIDSMEGVILNDLQLLVGGVILVPVYNDMRSVGANLEYQFVAFAEFMLTGFYYGSNENKHRPSDFYCPEGGPSLHCMEAIFMGYTTAPSVVE